MYHNKKGFTLIEIIVVLIIMGCLLAIAIPSIFGYVEKSRELTILTNAKGFMQAVQSISLEEYGAGNAYSPWAPPEFQVTYEAVTNRLAPPDTEKKRIREIYDLLEVDNIEDDFEAIALVDHAIVKIIRYKDFRTNQVYEWTDTSSTWEKIQSDNPNWAWAGEILPDYLLGSGIWWNGHNP